MYICTYVQVHMRIHVYVHMCVYVYIYMYVHIYIYVYTCMHVCIHVHRLYEDSCEYDEYKILEQQTRQAEGSRCVRCCSLKDPSLQIKRNQTEEEIGSEMRQSILPICVSGWSFRTRTHTAQKKMILTCCTLREELDNCRLQA